MATAQILEDSVEYKSGESVTFHQGAKIDIHRFKDVSEIWIADVSRRVFDNPQLSRRKRNAKDFCVFTRGGLCGDNYRSDMLEEDPTKPPMFNLDEAVDACYKWYRMADTIGGDGIILHVPTGQLLQWEKYFGKEEPQEQSLVSRVRDGLTYLLSKLR